MGGQVRQHGNYSFARVYQASSAIAATQPETAYRIFHRAIFGLDIAAGKVSTEKTPAYSSKGTRTASQAKQKAPAVPEPICYVLDPMTCTDKAWGQVYDSTGVLHQYILIDQASANLFPGVGVARNQSAGKINEGDAREARSGGGGGGGDSVAGSAASTINTTSSVPNGGTKSLQIGLSGTFFLVGLGFGVGALSLPALI